MVELLATRIETTITAPGLRITTRDPAGQFLVSGTDVPANTMHGTDPLTVWLAPGRSLVVAEAPAPPPAGDFVSDITDAFVVIDLAGPRASDVVAMASAHTPSAGHVAQTLFAGLRVILYYRGDTIRIHVERPHAAWLLDWLRQAATSFGDIS